MLLWGSSLGEASGLQSFFLSGRGQLFIDARMVPVTFKSDGITSLFCFYRERNEQRITQGCGRFHLGLSGSLKGSQLEKLN